MSFMLIELANAKNLSYSILNVFAIIKFLVATAINLEAFAVRATYRATYWATYRGYLKSEQKSPWPALTPPTLRQS